MATNLRPVSGSSSMPNDPLDEEALDISNIDTDDGADFVKQVFRDNEEQVANQLGGLLGVGTKG
jgi:hypothetical protein